jgi:hypothetical protein
MTELLIALKTFFQENLAEWLGLSPDGQALVPVTVYIGAPPTAQPESQYYPLLIIRPKDGQDNPDGGQNRTGAVVEIICGINVDDTTGTPEEGATGVCGFLDRVRLELLKTKRLGGRFALQSPLEWQVGDEEGDQPHPQYLVTITSRWDMPGIDRILTPEKEAEIYGSGFTGLSQAQE